MNKMKTDQLGNYEELLKKTLEDESEAIACLKVALEEYEKDKNFKQILIVIYHIAISKLGLRLNEILKPCPFCSPEEAEKCPVTLSQDSFNNPSVVCQNCECEKAGETIFEAIDFWNSRY